MGEYFIGPVTAGCSCGGETLGPIEPVARRISFSVANLASSRFRRSLSACRVVEASSRDVTFSSRSLTWRSFLSRKARWLGLLVWFRYLGL